MWGEGHSRQREHQVQRLLSRDVLGHVQGTAEVKCEWSGVSKGNSVEHEVREVEGSWKGLWVLF